MSNNGGNRATREIRFTNNCNVAWIGYLLVENKTDHIMDKNYRTGGVAYGHQIPVFIF